MTNLLQIYGCLAAMLLLGISSAQAQRGDKGKEQQPEVWRGMDVPPAPALSPDEALKTFTIAPGFRIERVAAEPMIHNPVAIKFDEAGRLWVVEMTAYMPTVGGKGEDARTGRVSVLEDTDRDGRMDQATVFLDELQMPRAIALVKGGLLIAEPPSLWYCCDTDGDRVCDEKIAVAKYARQGPVEHTENGLVPTLDNWMYNAKSSRKFRFIDGKIIEEKTNSRGQWGIAQDNYGRLYYNSNSSYLHADTVPFHYLQRNPNHKVKLGAGQRVVRTSEIFSSRVNPGINRGYQKSMLKPDGRLARVTAISGQAIYRGDQFGPEYVGDAFIPEPAANAVAHFSIIDKGIELSAGHHVYPHPTWDKVEFLTSTDERFRPVDAENGPDGALYIVDMYHGILQHKVYVTTFLRKQIIERKLDQHNQRGRIYRIVKKDQPINRQPPALANDPGGQVAALQHPNGWMRDTAQRLLVEQSDPSVVPALQKLAADTNHLAQIHALWTLDGLDQRDPDSWRIALASLHPQVRIAALRTGEPVLARVPELLDPLMSDTNRAVQIQLALSLGETKDLDRMHQLLAQHPGDRTLRDAVLTGLAGHEHAFLQRCQADPDWKDQEMIKILTELAAKTGGVPATAKLEPLSEADQKLFDAGRNDYLIACSACHLVSGEGQAAVAPTLHGVPWVTNTPPNHLIRIVLNGLMGPIEIDGEEWDLLMPPHRDQPILDDRKIAGVLTYIRRSWGNNAPPVQPADVARIREETEDQILPWSVEELLQIEEK